VQPTRDHTVVVLGASTNPDRYSNRAVRLLMEKGYNVIPVHPRAERVEGLEVKPELQVIDQAVDTLTVYVRPEIALAELDGIRELAPGRVILNPGTESAEMEEHLKEAGIEVVRACTLVLLRTDQF
jgi:hypothetical protein